MCFNSVRKAFLPAKDNRFSTCFTDNLSFRFGGSETWDLLFLRFKSLGFKGAVTGAEGSGKTTFMLQFGQYLKSKGFPIFYLRLSEDQKSGHLFSFYKALKKYKASEILLLDGYEQLDAFSRMFLKWRARNIKGLLISCHMKAPCKVLHHCETSPELLRELLRSLTGNEQFISTEDSELLLEKSGGNVRGALRTLYDYEASQLKFSFQ